MDAPIYHTDRNGKTVSIPHKSAESVARMQARIIARGGDIRPAIRVHKTAIEIANDRRKDERYSVSDLMRNNESSALKRAFS